MTDAGFELSRPANSLPKGSQVHACGSKVQQQCVLDDSTLLRTLPLHMPRNGTVEHAVTLPLLTPIQVTSNTTSQRLPPVTYSNCMSPPRDGIHPLGGGHETEGRGLQEHHEKAARRKELARRHLSNSLQGMRTVLPVLRWTQSFSVSAQTNGVKEHAKPVVSRRDSRSLGTRKPIHDIEIGTALKRTHSLREEANGSNGYPAHPLSLSLPQPTSGNVSLAALVHELNATMHYPSSPSRRPSTDILYSEDDEDETVGDLDYENGLDPDLCPRLTGQDACNIANRTLTPALRKLNKRRVSSRVRTQQWVNQIESDSQRNKPRTKAITKVDSGEKIQVSLIFEQEN